jgi:hypothetical protein
MTAGQGATPSETQIASAKGIIKRLISEIANRLLHDVIPRDDGLDVFEIGSRTQLRPLLALSGFGVHRPRWVWGQVT